jgi:hypothetical protein
VCSALEEIVVGIVLRTRYFCGALFVLLVFLQASIAFGECVDYANFSYRAGYLEASGFTNYDIFVQNEYAYVVDDSDKLQIFDLSDHIFPERVGLVDLDFEPRDICVSGSIAVITGVGKIVLMDISDPSLPSELGFLESDLRGQDLVIEGSLVYITESGEFTNSNRLRIIDISSPSAPAEISTLDFTPETVGAIQVSGDFAYICNDNSGLLVVDISEPEDPSIVATYSGGGALSDVKISGNLAYLVSGTTDPVLRILDISTSTNPFEIGSVNGFPSGWNKLAFSGTTCYVAGRTSDTYVVDVSDPTNPQIIRSLPYSDGECRDISIFGSYLYEGRRLHGYNITYIASPEGITSISSLNTSGSSQSVVVSDDRDGLAYLADGDGGMKVIDVSNPLNPVLLHTVDTPGFSSDVALSGNMAYVADGNSGLQIIDITDPFSTTPSIVGFVDTPGNAVDVSVVATLVFVADSEAGLRIVDANIPNAPQIIGVQDTLTLCQSVEVSGDYAYVADGIEGLRVLNVSDPENPWIIGGVKGRSWSNATDVEVHGTKAYVTDSGNGLHVVDIANPSNVLEIGHVETTGEAMHVSVSGSVAYVADSTSGMQLIDVADSSNLITFGNIDFQENALSTFVTDELVYVAAADGGLLLCPSQCTLSEIVVADFSSNAAVGLFYPAVVSFTNESDGYFQNCYWDFGDGVGTSTAMNPTYYYATPGDFTVTLTVTGSGNSNTITHDLRLLAPQPIISNIVDVPDDQGGFVFVNFTRSGHDDTSPSRSEIYTIQRQYGEQWVTVATSGAYGDHTYSVLAGTQGDGAEAYTTAYRVIAHMDEGIWIGPGLNGFSEDNIAPAVPQNAVWLEGGDLGWDHVADTDLAYYQIYGSPTITFTESEPVGTTIESFFAAPTDEYPWFFIAAVDDFGNHSAPVHSPSQTSGVPDAIKAVQLSAAVPNPFNPSTRIEYALPKTANVCLAVYDISGHLVKTLVNEVIESGIHGIDWHGTDEADRGVSAGAYFYRLETGDDVIIRRMMLIK